MPLYKLNYRKKNIKLTLTWFSHQGTVRNKNTCTRPQERRRAWKVANVRNVIAVLSFLFLPPFCDKSISFSALPQLIE